MAEQDETFLSRWARRKAEPETPEPELQPPPAEAEEKGELTEAEQQALIESLPDIESLDEKSDFSAFMQKGVPEVLQRRALRKLWRLNPVFAHLDGLNDYDDDFTDAAMVVEGMKTLFQVGKGMAEKVPEGEEEEGDPEAQAQAEQPDPPGEDPERSVAEQQAEEIAEQPESSDLVERPEDAESTAIAANVEEPLHDEVGSGRPAASRRWDLPET